MWKCLFISCLLAIQYWYCVLGYYTELHLTWHPYSKEVESESELLGRETTKFYSQYFEHRCFSIEDLGRMYIEAIEAYSQIIAVECERMRLVRVGCYLDLGLHLSESANEGGVVLREILYL